MKLFVFIFKGLRSISSFLCNQLDAIVTSVVLRGSGVQYSSFKTVGVPYVSVARKADKCIIGPGFVMNNGERGNPIGCNERCTIFVDNHSELIIGSNVGISQIALISHCSIKIGDNVKMGGGTCIYTTDFHALNAATRASSEDTKYRKTAPVIIGDNVFIGAKSIILKGVSIGKNSIIGAGSVVTKSVPANQIWAGNPAKFIRNIDETCSSTSNCS